VPFYANQASATNERRNQIKPVKIFQSTYVIAIQSKLNRQRFCGLRSGKNIRRRIPNIITLQYEQELE
jgi:hypothetical protein